MIPLLNEREAYKQLLYLKKNPVWISGFTSGEGSFTSSVMINVRAKWGIWPQCEFNITQLMHDKVLLQAINLYFNNTGGVYARKNGVGTVSFRDRNALKREIIPFFNKYTWQGAKNMEFKKWQDIFELVYSKTHVKDTLEARDILIDILLLLRELNASHSRNAKRKLNRNVCLIDWLKSLTTVPTKEQKLNLLKLVNNCGGPCLVRLAPRIHI